MLAGRYAITLRTSEGAHHERWRANDLSLEREVVLVCFSSMSTVAAAGMDAARRAAGVEDPRFVRVLDVGSDGPTAFIVEEPLTGALTLAQLLQVGGLPAEEVRRIVGECASALDKARHRGLHHLALGPSAVLRMPDGGIKVRGLATEAALGDADRSTDERALRLDAIGLVRIAYAGLTGRWPLAAGASGAAGMGLEPAPTIVGGVAAPSEIAVGVPNDLDLICRMTLNEHRGPISPGDLARQIAPWPAEMPVSDGATGIRLPASTDPQSTRVMPHLGDQGGKFPVGPVGLSGQLPPQTDPYGGAPPGAGAGAGHRSSTDFYGRLSDARLNPQVRGARPHPGAGMGATGPGVGGAPGFAGAASVGGAVGAAGAQTPAGASSRAPGRRSAHHQAAHDGERIALADALDEAPTGRLAPPLPGLGSAGPEGSQSRIALAIVGVLVVLALIVGLNNVAKIGDSEGTAGRPDVTVTATRKPTTATQTTPDTTASSPSPDTGPASPPPGGATAMFVSGKGFDPEDDNTEADRIANLTFDGNPGTTWKSRWYGSATYNGKKSGVGIVLDLAMPTPITQVQVTLPAAQSVTVFAATSDSLQGATQIGSSVEGQTGTVTFTADAATQPVTKLIVFVTKAAPDEAPDHYRAQISEVTVQ